MKLKWGPLPEAPDFNPSDPWRPLAEPSPEVLKGRAAPVAVGSALTVVLLWWGFADITRLDWIPAIVSGVVWLPGLIVLHEAIHAVLHPGFGLSGSTVIGYWLQHSFFYAAYLGEMSRERLVWVLLAPLVLVSLVPLAAAPVTGTSGIIVCISVTNALLSCGDVLGAGYVLRGTPAGAQVRNKGWKTYWMPKPDPERRAVEPERKAETP